MNKKKPNKNGDVFEAKDVQVKECAGYAGDDSGFLFKHEDVAPPRRGNIPDLAAVMANKAAVKKSEMKQFYSNVRNNPPPPPSGSPGYYQESLSLEDADEAICDHTMTINGGCPPDGYNIQTDAGYTPKFEGSKPCREKPVMANTASTIPALPEDINLLKDSITFERVSEKIYVNLVAINKQQPEKNTIESIKAGGDPLGGYAYTPEGDHFLIGCCDHMSLGLIPMAFRMVVTGYAGKQLVPLPEPLVFKHASPQQRKMIKMFVEKNANCEIQFVQALCRS